MYFDAPKCLDFLPILPTGTIGREETNWEGYLYSPCIIHAHVENLLHQTERLTKE